MHPDILRQLAGQRSAERRQAAENSNMARALRRAIRAQRTRHEALDDFDIPAIPDYVDGTFSGAGHQVPAQHAGADR